MSRSTSATAEANKLIEAEQAKGLSREKATAKVFKRNPGLRERMIEEANVGRGVRE